MRSRKSPPVPDTVSSTDGVTLYLYDLGGSGPPLIMAHATGFCGQVWGPMAETLSSQYRCIAFDFRAHGRSSRPVDHGLEWQGMADDVLAVVDAVSPGRPVAAVGHSMGGAALVLAETSRPGTLSMGWTFEPILFGSTPFGPTSEPSEISEGARRRRPTFASRDEAAERYSAKPPLSFLDSRVMKAYVDHGFEDLADGTVTLRCKPEDEAAVFENHNSGARQQVGDLTIPFLVAASGDGRPPAQAVLEAAKEFDHLELREYPSLSHFGPLEDPDRVGHDCLQWLVQHAEEWMTAPGAGPIRDGRIPESV